MSFFGHGGSSTSSPRCLLRPNRITNWAPSPPAASVASLTSTPVRRRGARQSTETMSSGAASSFWIWVLRHPQCMAWWKQQRLRLNHRPTTGGPAAPSLSNHLDTLLHKTEWIEGTLRDLTESQRQTVTGIHKLPRELIVRSLSCFQWSVLFIKIGNGAWHILWT